MDGSESSVDVEFDVKGAYKPTVAVSSAIKKGCGVWLSPEGSRILPINQT